MHIAFAYVGQLPAQKTELRCVCVFFFFWFVLGVVDIPKSRVSVFRAGSLGENGL